MRLAHGVRLGAWLLVGLNLIMAFASVGIFMRMAPAITTIIERNERSLQACEDMLASLALVDTTARADDLRAQFDAALVRAQNNITEADEQGVLDLIEVSSAAAFAGDLTARQQAVAAIVRLGKINREAMIAADSRARQLGYAGAWGIVFMATCAFLVAMIFIRGLSRRVVMPLEEIHTVIAAQRQGDTMRRCTGGELSPDMREVYNGINEILDQVQGGRPSA
jgi:hypothetical protein